MEKQNVHARVAGARALELVRLFFQVLLSSSFPLLVSVDLCPDFLQFQGPFCCVESRWKANCQRQPGQNHQDFGLAIWRLPVDADQA